MQNALIGIALIIVLGYAFLRWCRKKPELPAVDVREVVDINIPVRAVFDEWAEFERYPHFIEGVKDIKVLDHWTMRWKAELRGQTVEFDAVMDEQVPDKRLAWTAHSEPQHKVALQFTRLSASRTRLTVEIQIAGTASTLDALETAEAVRKHVAELLSRCKRMLEERGRGYGYLSVRGRLQR